MFSGWTINFTGGPDSFFGVNGCVWGIFLKQTSLQSHLLLQLGATIFTQYYPHIAIFWWSLIVMFSVDPAIGSTNILERWLGQSDGWEGWWHLLTLLCISQIRRRGCLELNLKYFVLRNYFWTRKFSPPTGGFFLVPAEGSKALRAQRWFCRTDGRTDNRFKGFRWKYIVE